MDTILSLTADMLYVLIAICIIPSGFIIWYNTFVHFWRKKTLVNGIVVGWNTYAQIKNTLNIARNMPSVLSRIAKAFLGGKGKKGKGVIILFAVFVLILAVCGGYFTASAIMKKADREYDGLAEFSPDLQKSNGRVNVA